MALKPQARDQKSPQVIPLYQEMVRENERILDRQFHSLSRADEKNVFAFKLTVLSLVFGISMAAFRLQATAGSYHHIEILMNLLLFIGMVCHIMALLFLGQAFFSLGGALERFTESPQEDWLLRKINDPDHCLRRHLPPVVRGLARAIKKNDMLMKNTALIRRNALRILVIGFLSNVIMANIIYFSSS